MKSFWAISSIYLKVVSDISKTLYVSRGSLVKEGVEIWIIPSNVNIDMQFPLSHSWNPATRITDDRTSKETCLQWTMTSNMNSDDQPMLCSGSGHHWLTPSTVPHVQVLMDGSFMYKYSVWTQYSSHLSLMTKIVIVPDTSDTHFTVTWLIT